VAFSVNKVTLRQSFLEFFLLFLSIFIYHLFLYLSLRHCATSRKVAGSNPDGDIGIFHCHNLSGRNVALDLTQPLTEMSTMNISWGVKAAGAYG
jgi:hypothetical protein